MKKIFLFLLLFYAAVQGQNKVIVPKDSMEYEMEQLTVTATRYSEPLIEIPYAVSLISGKELMSAKGYGFDNILNSVPGVLAQVRAGNQDMRIVIRGFGARGAGDRSNYGTSRGIRVMIDGIPETEPDGRTSFDLIDLGITEGMEIIRSNASATWGNAAGGVINLSTVPTASSSNNFMARGTTGSFGFEQILLKGRANFKNGILYGSLTNVKMDGWRQHSSSFRTLMNLGFISMLNEKSKLGVFVLGASNMFHVPGPLSQKQFDEDPSQANIFYLNRDERRLNRLGRIGLTFDTDFDSNNSFAFMMFASPKYLQRSERGTYRDFTRYHIGGNFMYKNVSELSKSIVNTFIAGGDEAFQDGAILFYSLSPSNQRGEELRTNKREGANNLGAFIHNEIVINNKLSILGGVRFDWITYYSEDFLNPVMGLQSKTFERVTPKAGITYRVTPSLSIYGNLGGGVEVPAGNETDPSSTYGQDEVYLLNPLLDAINSTTYELGTKQIYFFGSNNFIKWITVDLAYYHIDIKNDIIPYRGGRFYFTAGETKRNGLEIGTEMEFAHNLRFKGALTYSDNYYDEYLVDSVHYGIPGKITDYKGKKVAGIPSLFYNLNLKYTPDYLKGFFLSATVSSVGSYFVDDFNSIEVPAYSVINLTAGLDKPLKILGNISINGFFTINNITDEKYAASAFINPDIVNGEALYLEPGLPRNFIFSLSVNF